MNKKQKTYLVAFALMVMASTIVVLSIELKSAWEEQMALSGQIIKLTK